MENSYFLASYVLMYVDVSDSTVESPIHVTSVILCAIEKNYNHIYSIYYSYIQGYEWNDKFQKY